MRWWPVVALPVLAVVLYLQLRGYADPPGTDGYFYLLQTQSLADGQGFYFKDSSLVFAPLAALAWLFGDALAAVRVVAALTWAGLVVLGGVVASRMAPRHALAVGVAATVCLALALPLRQLVLEYLKMGFSLLLLVAAVSLRWAPHPGPPPASQGEGGSWAPLPARGERLGEGLLLLAALLSHRGALLFLGAYAVAWLLGGRSWRRVAVVLAGAATAMLVVLLFFDRALPFFTAWTRFVSPPMRWWLWLTQVAPKEPGVLVSLMLWPLSLVLAPRRELTEGGRRLFDTSVVLMVIALLPVLVPGPSGFTYRLLLASPLFFVPMLLAGSKRAPAVVLVTLLVAQLALDPGLAARVPRWSRLDGTVGGLRHFVSDEDLLVTHHGLEFYVAQRTGLRARQFIDPATKKRTFRLAWIEKARVHDAVTQHALLELNDEYALFAEDDWNALRARFSIPADAMNPAVPRPAFVSDYP